MVLKSFVDQLLDCNEELLKAVVTECVRRAIDAHDIIDDTPITEVAYGYFQSIAEDQEIIIKEIFEKTVISAQQLGVVVH